MFSIIYKHAQFQKIRKYSVICVLVAPHFLITSSCKKLVAIDPPNNSITTSEVFADSADATSVMAGLYSKIINTGGLSVGCGYLDIYGGYSSDELVNFQSDPLANQFYRNQLNANNGVVNTIIWSQFYTYLYQANSIIEGTQASDGLSLTVKAQLSSEAKFIRALSHFYLTNLFGDIPLVTTTNYKTNATIPRTQQADVYSQIISDLRDGVNNLRTDYSISNGDRTRVNKWAAAGLLARVYLYQKKWDSAAQLSSSIIANTNLFGLVSTPDSVFLINSTEAILQWANNPSQPPYNATPEGDYLIPYDSTYNPNVYISDELLNSFESGDTRKALWVNSVNYSGTDYYYPYKYKVGPADEAPGVSPTEYYMVLRLAEQYLIRAEAEANGAGGGLTSAIADINVIRNRASLADYSGPMDKNTVLDAIAHERQVELFAEWGHRWLDLKRWGNAPSVLSTNKGFVVSQNSLLYPIPISEIIFNSSLTQNPGY